MKNLERSTQMYFEALQLKPENPDALLSYYHSKQQVRGCSGTVEQLDLDLAPRSRRHLAVVVFRCDAGRALVSGPGLSKSLEDGKPSCRLPGNVGWNHR